jgi:hypothetical protein
MTSIAIDRPSAEQSERLFFLVMALAIAATVALGFGLWYRAGISSFDAPWWVHVHAVTFVTWIAFYLIQNTLIFRNDVALHRRLGWFGAGLAAWMVLVGLVLTPVRLAVHRSPPIFTPSYFLALDMANIVFFGGLIIAAIANRKRTDWHRRLALCATICVIAPAWGRLLDLSGITITAATNVSALLVYVVVAMIADWRIRGRVHPAYLWGFAALIGMGVADEALAAFPPFIHFANALVAG